MEYLLKIGYSRLKYSLINMYIIKNEISRIFKLEEGDLRMITYLPNDQEINIEDLQSQKYMHKEIRKGIFLSDYQLIL